MNLPSWAALRLRVGAQEATGLDDVEQTPYRCDYATVARVLRFRDRSLRETTLRSRRFVSMADLHQAEMEWTLTAENWSGQLDGMSALDARVNNAGVARYRELEGRHQSQSYRGGAAPT